MLKPAIAGKASADIAGAIGIGRECTRILWIAGFYVKER